MQVPAFFERACLLGRPTLLVGIYSRSERLYATALGHILDRRMKPHAFVLCTQLLWGRILLRQMNG